MPPPHKKIRRKGGGKSHADYGLAACYATKDGPRTGEPCVHPLTVISRRQRHTPQFGARAVNIM